MRNPLITTTRTSDSTPTGRADETQPGHEIVHVGVRRAGDVMEACAEPLLSRFDPFSVIDVIGPEPIGPGPVEVPEQPVAGINTLTYVVRGSLEHVDSTGECITVRAGEVFSRPDREPGLVQQQWLRGDDEGVVHVVRVGYRTEADRAADARCGSWSPRWFEGDMVRHRYLVGWDYVENYVWRLLPASGEPDLFCCAEWCELEAGASRRYSRFCCAHDVDLFVVVAGGSVVVDGEVVPAGSVLAIPPGGPRIEVATPVGALLLELEGPRVGSHAAAFGIVMDDEDRLDQAWQDYLTCRMGWID